MKPQKSIRVITLPMFHKRKYLMLLDEIKSERIPVDHLQHPLLNKTAKQPSRTRQRFEGSCVTDEVSVTASLKLKPIAITANKISKKGYSPKVIKTSFLHIN